MGLVGVSLISVIPLGYFDFPDIKHEHAGGRNNSRDVAQMEPIFPHLLQHHLEVVEPIPESYQVAVADYLYVK